MTEGGVRHAPGHLARHRHDSATGLAPGTQVAVATGWQSVETLTPGTPVFARDGRKYPVRAVELLPASTDNDTYVVGFGNGVEVTVSAHQNWPIYDRAGRVGLRQSSQAQRVAWRRESVTLVERLRSRRASVPEHAEATLPELLRLLRSSGIQRWHDAASLRAAIGPYVPTVGGYPASSPAAMWAVHDVLRYLDFRVSRDTDVPFGRLLATCEVARLVSHMPLAVPAPAPLESAVVCVTSSTGSGRATGISTLREMAEHAVLTGQPLPPPVLRAPRAQREQVLAGIEGASGLGPGTLLAVSERQVSGFVELLASLGLTHRVTWTEAAGSKSGKTTSRFHIQYLPAAGAGFVAVQTVRAAEPTRRVAVRSGSPDGTFLISGLLVAHG